MTSRLSDFTLQASFTSGQPDTIAVAYSAGLTEPSSRLPPSSADGATQLGRLLRRYRRAAELTQEELAERAGLSARAISDLERGAKSRPHRATIDLLAEALRLEEDERRALHSARTSSTHSQTSPRLLPTGGFLGAMPEGELVAREAELVQISAALDAAVVGAGRLIVLVGEPGVGKTRLAQELALRAGARGCAVGAGSCYAPRQAVPYYPFLDALASLYVAAPPALRDRIQERWPHLERLLPEPDTRTPDLAAVQGGPDEVDRLARSVAAFLHSLAETTPVVLLLDDLQWADEATLNLLHHLGRSTRGSRVLLLGTYRDTDVRGGHPLESILRDLDRDRLVRRLPVQRLDRAGTAALIAASLGEADVSEEFAGLIYRFTEGNAFFTQEVVQALVERGDLFRSSEGWRRRGVAEIEVPESVRSAVGERLARLAEGTQSVLQEASVLGQSFAFEPLRLMGGSGDDVLEAALEEALWAGIVRVTSDDTYQFNHALTQHVLYAGLLPQRRRRLHRSAGEALESLPAATWRSQGTRRAAEVAWHFLEGNDRERALPYAVTAGQEAESLFAHAEAEHHYRIALELTRQVGDVAREAYVRERLATLLTVTIRYPDALDMLGQAAALHRAAGQSDNLARAVAQMARVHLGAGTTEEGAGLLATALSELAPGASAGALAELNSALGRCLHVSGRYAEALAAAERAIGLAGVEESGVLAESSVTRGAALTMLGRWTSGLSTLEEAVETAERAGDTFSACRGLQYAACVRIARGELHAAKEHMERARRLAEQMRSRRQTATTIFGLSLVALLVGELDSSREYARQALDMVRSLGGFWLSILQAAALSLALRPKEWSVASPELRECAEIMEADTPLPALRAEQQLAAQDLDEGRAQAALARLTALLSDPRVEEEQAEPIRQLLVQASVEVGNEGEAAGVIEDGLQRAESEGLRLRQVGWMRVQALLLARLGHRDEAASTLSEAMGLARKMPYSYAEADLLRHRELVLEMSGGTG